MIVLVAASVIVVGAVRRPFPSASGEVPIAGLQAEVTVERGPQGVPQITATSSADLFRAQGYVHAQDRFFEMDYRRHVTAGRLAELVGDNPDAIAADRVVRTFGGAGSPSRSGRSSTRRRAPTSPPTRRA